MAAPFVFTEADIAYFRTEFTFFDQGTGQLRPESFERYAQRVQVRAGIDASQIPLVIEGFNQKAGNSTIGLSEVVKVLNDARTGRLGKGAGPSGGAGKPPMLQRRKSVKDVVKAKSSMLSRGLSRWFGVDEQGEDLQRWQQRAMTKEHRVNNELVRQASKLSRSNSRLSQSSLTSGSDAGAGALRRKPSVRVLKEETVELKDLKLKTDDDDSDGSYYEDSDEEANQYMSAVVSRTEQTAPAVGEDGQLPDLELAGASPAPKPKRGVRIGEPAERGKRRKKAPRYQREDWFGYDDPKRAERAGVPVRALRPVDYVELEQPEQPASAVPAHVAAGGATLTPPRSPANPMAMRAVPSGRASSPSPHRASEDVAITVVAVPRASGPMNPAEARAMPKTANRGRASVARRQRRSQRSRPSGDVPKLARMNTFVRKQVASMPTFRPWFIYSITIVQIIVMIVELAVGHLSPIGFSTKTVTGSVTGFNGDPVAVSRNESQNFWIGPDTTFIIHWGAKYTPCMRKDQKTMNAIDLQNALEDAGGCCQIKSTQGLTRCGWQQLSSCNANSGTFYKAQTCETVPACVGNIVVRPCCVGYQGECLQLTPDACDFFKGYYHAGADKCSEVHCLDQVCGLGGLKNPNSPDQGIRFLTPIFLHVGIFHLVFNLMMQLGVGRQIERTAGWLRTALIYFISGVGGNLFSAIFIPYQPQVGASGSLYGLLAVLLVELFQSWQLITNPWRELIKLILVIGVSLMIGTLPWWYSSQPRLAVDNFAHIGGFITGLLAGIIFLPYIVFGKWDARRKRILIGVAVPLLLALFIVGFIVFYQTQSADFCPWCKYLTCVPYTKNFCDGINIG